MCTTVGFFFPTQFVSIKRVKISDIQLNTRFFFLEPTQYSIQNVLFGIHTPLNFLAYRSSVVEREIEKYFI